MLAAVALAATPAAADEPVVKVLCDFETDAVAAEVTAVSGALASDCTAKFAAIPARGQRSLAIEVGSTAGGAWSATELRFRIATPFDKIDRIAAYAWANSGEFEVSFRLRDSNGAAFETPALVVSEPNRWTRLVAPIDARTLRAGGAESHAAPVWPMEVIGVRCVSRKAGKHAIHLDDLEVEHTAPPTRSVFGEFRLSEPTHIYPPGSVVNASVVIENLSRSRAQTLTVQLAWRRADGSDLTSSRAALSLPASGVDYRALQEVDFSQKIEESGLFRLVATVQAPGWLRPVELETTIAVTPSNRALPRGRSTFFGVRSNLLREPRDDQMLEIQVAREIGVQLLAFDAPWRLLEPSQGRFDWVAIDEVVDAAIKRDIAPMISLQGAPEWLPAGGENRVEAVSAALGALARHFGAKVRLYEIPELSPPLSLAEAEQVRSRVREAQAEAEVFAPGVTNSTDPNVTRVFASEGSAAEALESLRALAGDAAGKGAVWMHRSGPAPGSGGLVDAVAMLRLCVAAAERGIESIVLYDLRDDTTDPRYPEQMRGLVRRDFSPKAAMVGLASAIGMLSAQVYSGQVSGAGPEFESALFLGGARQTAILFPKPNVALPSIVTPLAGVAGKVQAFDFERREVPVQQSVGAPVVAVSGRPMFITLTAQRAQNGPQLSLSPPWIRVPGVVFCDDAAVFSAAVSAPAALRSAFLQLVLPDGGPLQSDFSAKALKGKAGEVTDTPIRLQRVAGDDRAATVLVRVSIEQRVVEAPVTVRKPYAMPPLKDGTPQVGPNAFAVIREDGARLGQKNILAIASYAGYSSAGVALMIELPSNAPPDWTLDVGLAREGAPRHVELAVSSGTGTPAVAVQMTAGSASSETVASLVELPNGRRAVRVDIPAGALGVRSLQAGDRLLGAVRYGEPPLPGLATGRVASWGAGLGGSRRTQDFEWVVLTD